MRWKGAEVLRLSDAEATADYTAAAVKEGLIEALQTRADSLLSRVTDVVRIRRALGSQMVAAIEKLMGLVLTAVAVEMILAGLKRYFLGL